MSSIKTPCVSVRWAFIEKILISTWIIFCYSYFLCKNTFWETPIDDQRMWVGDYALPYGNGRKEICEAKLKCCCNLSSGVALIVWFTTNGMCVKNNTIMYVARTSNNRVISSGDLYSCLLPRCEALRTCRSGFPIAIVSTDTTWRNTHAGDVKHHFGDVYEILPNSTHPQLHFTVLGFLKLASERKHISLMLASEKRRFLQWQAQGQQNP